MPWELDFTESHGFAVTMDNHLQIATLAETLLRFGIGKDDQNLGVPSPGEGEVKEAVRVSNTLVDLWWQVFPRLVR